MAQAEGISLAELIRRLAAKHLDRSGATPVRPEAYRGVIGLGASGRSDVGAKHDVNLARALRRKHAG